MIVTVITGASDGIGAELARQLATVRRERAGLILAARSEEKLRAIADECTRLGAHVEWVMADVSVRADCDRLIAVAAQRFGRIDTLYNNAGLSAHALLREVPPDKLDWYEYLMRVNYWGTLWCTYAALPHLIASKGRIVGVSSHAGLFGVPGRTAYSGSKFAVAGMLEALRAEVKPLGVSVTVVYPGVVDTAIRLHGFNAQGQQAGVSGLREEGMMPVETCVRLMRKAVDARQRECVMTAKARFGRWMKLLAPGWVERKTMEAVKDDFRPQ